MESCENQIEHIMMFFKAGKQKQNSRVMIYITRPAYLTWGSPPTVVMEI